MQNTNMHMLSLHAAQNVLLSMSLKSSVNIHQKKLQSLKKVEISSAKVIRLRRCKKNMAKKLKSLGTFNIIFL